LATVDRLGAAGTALLAAALLAFSAGSGAAARRAGAAVYSGVGAWVDIFATPARANPEAVVASLRARGVSTLYLETSNYGQRDPIVHPAGVSRFLEAAHAAGIAVVGWYLPSLLSPRRDLARSLAAIRFRSPDGQQFDSFALDIEASLVHAVPLRNSRLLALLQALRDAVGAGYPLGAIIPSPVGMQQHPTYWPDFPFRGLAAVVDAFAPMAYFSYSTHTEAGVYAYTRAVVRAIRTRTGRPGVPIQLIGGIADKIGPGALAGFARAATVCAVAGISLYGFLETNDSEWRELRSVRLGVEPGRACAA
jgi:hypothetical protein